MKRKRNRQWLEDDHIYNSFAGLEMVQWAHANGCPWTEESPSYVTEHGQLDILQFMHQNGCPFTADTFASVASGGHLEILH